MFKPSLFVGIALAYAVLKLIFEKRLACLDAEGQERRPTDLASAGRCSLYGLFLAAALLTGNGLRNCPASRRNAGAFLRARRAGSSRLKGHTILSIEYYIGF